MSEIVKIILACLGSTGLFSFIQFLIQRKDKKNGELYQIKSTLNKLEKDTCRTQMLLLMSDYPEEKKELLTLAEHYFSHLKGNFYMESIFQDWLKKNNVPTPKWFKANQ